MAITSDHGPTALSQRLQLGSAKAQARGGVCLCNLQYQDGTIDARNWSTFVTLDLWTIFRFLNFFLPLNVRFCERPFKNFLSIRVVDTWSNTNALQVAIFHTSRFCSLIFFSVCLSVRPSVRPRFLCVCRQRRITNWPFYFWAKMNLKQFLVSLSVWREFLALSFFQISMTLQHSPPCINILEIIIEISWIFTVVTLW